MGLEQPILLLQHVGAWAALPDAAPTTAVSSGPEDLADSLPPLSLATDPLWLELVALAAAVDNPVPPPPHAGHHHGPAYTPLDHAEETNVTVRIRNACDAAGGTAFCRKCFYGHRMRLRLEELANLF